MSLTKAIITNEDTKEQIQVLFNPNEYTIAKTNSWQQQKGGGRDVPQFTFTGGESRTLSMELFFDVYEEANKDVREEVEKLWKLTRIDKSLKNRSTGKGRPPLVTFQWGGNWYFKAAITSLSVRFTLFRMDGIPVRATASVTFQEAEDETKQPRQNPTSGSLPGHRRREVRPEETLAHIAFEEYGDSTRWRPIAEANGIDDPLSIRPGQVLAIPAM